MLNAFARYASVPIINLESAMHHPCQSLADMLTIREKLGAGRKRVVLTWAWHPKPLPMAVPNSFALAAAQMGHDLVIAHPAGLRPRRRVDRNIATSAGAGGSVEITNDIDAAFTGAEVIYAKSWGAKQFYGNTDRGHRDARTVPQQVDCRRRKDGAHKQCDLHALFAGAPQRDRD